ncbi:hypothetical protein [Streptomyces sp. WAC01280]|uniref:hypothetical protein n=1 Tax=Streptomyces sp. WAC01280 TaxID=2487424 RepID=UPI000F7A6E32|nr:hypothetical protein [Streptomyces sp. WAC01280]RSS51443.1 hypothetical protein EF909_34710 [Streptomyces sp. WAC01280]
MKVKKAIESLRAARARRRPLLKLLDEGSQIVLFSGLLVLQYLFPPFGGFWNWAIRVLFGLGLLGAVWGAVRAWRVWRRDPARDPVG